MNPQQYKKVLQVKGVQQYLNNILAVGFIDSGLWRRHCMTYMKLYHHIIIGRNWPFNGDQRWKCIDRWSKKRKTTYTVQLNLYFIAFPTVWTKIDTLFINILLKKEEICWSLGDGGRTYCTGRSNYQTTVAMHPPSPHCILLSDYWRGWN